MSATETAMDTAAAFTPRQFRDAMGQFATGVVTVSTRFDGNAHAMTVNAFMSGSLEPPLVLVSVAKSARMHERLQQSGGFGVSVLADHQQWCSDHFAGKPSPHQQPTFVDLQGVPVLENANVRLAADLHHVYDCGDHTLFVGRVKALVVAAQALPPLLFHGGRYAALQGAQA